MQFKHKLVSLLAAIGLVVGFGLAGASPAQASEDSRGGRHCIRVGDRCQAPHNLNRPKGYPGHVTTFTCPCYYYGQGQATVASSTTSSANLTVWKPTVTAGDFHSLVELSVADSTQNNIVEVGWGVDLGVNGDSNPHLFVYHWVNGASTCYNACGWVDNALNTTLNAGSTLTPSTSGGTTITLRTGISHQAVACGASAGGWWVTAYYSTGTAAYIGCFPDSLWTSPTFTSFTRILAFGEVAANTTSPTTQMGSGVCPAATPVFNTTAFIGSVNANSSLVSLSWSATDSTKYNEVNPSASSGYVGGDGSCP